MNAPTVVIDRLSATLRHDRGQPPPSADRLRGPLRRAIGGPLETALRGLDLPPGRWCLARLDLTLALDPARPEPALAREWSEAVAAAIERTVREGRTTAPGGLVHFRHDVELLADAVAGLAAGRRERLWAWRQTGILRAGDPAPDASPGPALLAALERHPQHAAAAVLRAAEQCGLPALHRAWGGEGWQRLATLVTGGEPPVAGDTGGPPPGPGTRALARALLAGSRLADLVRASRLRPAEPVPAAWAVLVLAETDPASLHRAAARPGLRELLAQGLRAPDGAPARPAPATGPGRGQLPDRGPCGDGGSDGAGGEGERVGCDGCAGQAGCDGCAGGQARCEGCTGTAGCAGRVRCAACVGWAGTDGTAGPPAPPGPASPAGGPGAVAGRGAPPHEPPAAGAPRTGAGGSGPGPAGSAAADTAAPDPVRPARPAPAPDPRGAATGWAGLLFLLATAAEAGLPDRALDEPALATRPLPWTLHTAALALVPGIAPADPAALALAGLGLDRAAGLLRAAAATPRERDAVGALAADWARATAARLGDGPYGHDPSGAVLTVARRPGRIAAETGWIEAVLAVADTDPEIRRAGLDLDPGWLGWLGAVVRYRYV
ncbi:hypothetical protein [Streptomyces sp. NPDC056387]|uniref:hypothetical protein n=1 Tax=Streptomyces sp. NPDC056387 TaxID=3345803 RepID=UPI0035DA36C7